MTAATACPLATALGDVAAGGSIELVTSGIEGTSATYYSGTFTVSTGGTSSSARVTIEPAAGVTDPILDGGSAGTVLTIDADVWADVDGVTIQDGVTDSGALGTPVGEVGANGGGIRNAGTMQLTNSTISDNRTGDGGNGRNGGIFAGGGGGGNGGAGAGIDNTGTLSLTTSTVSGNVTGVGGNGGNGGNGGDNEAIGAAGPDGTVGEFGPTGDNGGAAGSGGDGGDGAGVDNSGTLSLTTSTVTANSTGSGGTGGTGG
ncbi:MAG: hypothetical protein ACRDV6_08100, partial [Acidimicrobiales bacterium]